MYERNAGKLNKHPLNDRLHGVFSLPDVLEGGAGIYSTIDDVMLFGRMLLVRREAEKGTGPIRKTRWTGYRKTT